MLSSLSEIHRLTIVIHTSQIKDCVDLQHYITGKAISFAIHVFLHLANIQALPLVQAQATLDLFCLAIDIFLFVNLYTSAPQLNNLIT